MRSMFARAAAGAAAATLAVTALAVAPAGAAEPTAAGTQTVGSEGHVRYYGAADGPDGSTIVVGWLQTPDGGVLPETDALVRKLDSSGNVVWETVIADEGTADYASAVDVGPDGSIFVTGRTRGDIGGRTGGTDFDMFVAKLSSSGAVQWTEQYGNNGTNRDDAGLAVVGGNDGSVFVGMYLSTEAKPVIQRYSSSGTELWTFLYGEDGDFIEDMALGRDGSAYVSGNGSAGDGFLISASLGGTSSSSTRMPGAGSMRISATPDGDIIAGGGSYLGRFTSFGINQWAMTDTGVDIVDVSAESDDSIVAIVEGSAILRGFSDTGALEGWTKPLAGDAPGSSVVATSNGGVVAITPAAAWESMNVARFTGSSDGDGTVAGFTDVAPGAYYADAVAWLKSEGITTGTSETTYSPDNNVTRGQMAAFLHRMVGEPGGNPAHGFTDVADGTFFTEAVRWLKDQGITTGTSDTTYSPDGNVTRAQMAAFLWRLAGEPTGNPAHGFSDVPDGTYYTEAVRWLKDQGITTGTSDTTYSPDDNVTRAQMAAFLYRMATDSDWDYPGD